LLIIYTQSPLELPYRLPHHSPTRRSPDLYFHESEFLEDVFTMNDFGFPLKPPSHPRYLNTEFIGHTYPTKTIDNVERLREHTLRDRKSRRLNSSHQIIS